MEKPIEKHADAGSGKSSTKNRRHDYDCELHSRIMVTPLGKTRLRDSCFGPSDFSDSLGWTDSPGSCSHSPFVVRFGGQSRCLRVDRIEDTEDFLGLASKPSFR
jgi:hypothetical protein